MTNLKECIHFSFTYKYNITHINCWKSDLKWRDIHTCIEWLTVNYKWCASVGYTEKEVRKEKLKVHDQGENPKAPAPKEMVDLEVHSVVYSVTLSLWVCVCACVCTCVSHCVCLCVCTHVCMEYFQSRRVDQSFEFWEVKFFSMFNFSFIKWSSGGNGRANYIHWLLFHTTGVPGSILAWPGLGAVCCLPVRQEYHTHYVVTCWMRMKSMSSLCVFCCTC